MSIQEGKQLSVNAQGQPKGKAGASPLCNQQCIRQARWQGAVEVSGAFEKHLLQAAAMVNVRHDAQQLMVQGVSRRCAK
jgi:hypothetical protein